MNQRMPTSWRAEMKCTNSWKHKPTQVQSRRDRKSEQTQNWQGDRISHQNLINKQTKALNQWLPRRILQVFKAELISILPKLFQNIEEEHFLTHSMRPTLLMPKPDKDTPRKESYISVIFMNTDVKSLNEIPANRIQQFIKRTIHYGHEQFLLAFKDGQHIKVDQRTTSL